MDFFMVSDFKGPAIPDQEEASTFWGLHMFTFYMCHAFVVNLFAPAYP